MVERTFGVLTQAVKSLDKERGESCQHTGGILGLPHFLYDSPQGYSWQLHKRKNHPKNALVEVQEYKNCLQQHHGAKLMSHKSLFSMFANTLAL